MLVRNNQLGDPNKFYNDAMLETPTVADTVFDNFASGFATPSVALNMVEKDFARKPDGKAILSSLDNIRLAQENPNLGWGQWLAGEGANMIGMALNPLTWGLGAIGEGAGAGIIKGTSKLASKALPDAASVFMRKPLKELLAEPIAKYLPSQIGKAGAEKDLSAALLSEKSLSTFGAFAGAGVPQGVVDNFNRDTNHIGWGGVAREAGEMGAFGVLIGTIPFTWGVLRGKINRGLGRGVNDVVNVRDLDQAVEKGHITKDEHAWYVDYLEHQKNPNDVEKLDSLKERATQIAGDNGHKTNAVSNEALFDILTPDNMSNLHGVIADQLASAHLPEEQRLALSNFIVHSRLDELRSNPQALDGVRGYVDFINKKLANKDTTIELANRILNAHLLRGMKDNMIFSQKELFKMMRKSGFESSHLQHLPITIPENMKAHFKLAEKISYVKEKVNKDKRKGLPENKQTVRRIAELEAKLPKILTPKEELTHIRKTLLSDKGLPQRWQNSVAYHRLLDLSHVWENAKTLLDRVHMEDEYNRQTAFKDLSESILKISDSDQTAFAKPENVVEYLKARIEGQLHTEIPMKDIAIEVEEQQKVPADADQILAEQDRMLKNTEATDAKKELDASSLRYKEFKNSENVFKNLISCVLGGLGG